MNLTTQESRHPGYPQNCDLPIDFEAGSHIIVEPEDSPGDYHLAIIKIVCKNGVFTLESGAEFALVSRNNGYYFTNTANQRSFKLICDSGDDSRPVAAYGGENDARWDGPVALPLA